MIYFTSDWHLNHANIIKYTNRPFKTVQDMNECILSRCNERIKETDTLFFLGDLGFKSGTGRGEGEPEKLQTYIDKIKCKNIIWVEGNHDKAGRNGFKTIIRRLVVSHGGRLIGITHDPKFAEEKYDLNFCGHVHQLWQFKEVLIGQRYTTLINVGVDVWNFYPVTFNEIISKLMTWRKNNEK